MNKGKLVVTIAASVAAGALLGVLLAPDKGKKTRKQLTKKGLALKENIKDKLNILVDDAIDEYETAKEKASGIIDKAQAKKDAIKENLKEALS
ncbi:MAG: YtxH domain-containing protein [Bacteroidetes bacterium]|nr:YtxH domain-containing protein [Bacteroidota bacterium]